MGYDFHITRADFAFDSAMYPISLDEWIAVAEAEPTMTKPRYGSARVGSYDFAYSADQYASIDWFDGGIRQHKGAPTARLAAIAQKLGARLIGDDAEEYHVDGSHTPWTEPRPVLFRRALTVAETLPAWKAISERIFDEDGGSSRQPGPGHVGNALRSFRKFAARDVAAADVPDADGLLYQCGPGTTAGAPTFTVSFVRQLAVADDGGLAQVECRLVFAMVPVVAAVGNHHEWWFPTSRTSRDAWFDALSCRPELRRLDFLRPLSVAFTHDEVC